MPKELVDEAKHSIREQFGPNAAVTLGQESDKLLSDVPGYISTQCTGIDYAIGRLGVPLGRISELFGWEATGKTLIGIQLMKECQRLGGVSVMIDSEQAFDRIWVEKLGLDLSTRVLFLQPDTLEETLGMIENVSKTIKEVKTDVPVVIIWDSLPASKPEAEIKGEYGSGALGLTARLMSKSLSRLKNVLSKEQIALVIINQYREKIGIQFGDSRTTPGGKALKFYASLRIELSVSKQLETNGKIIGIQGKAYVKKNKVAMPFGRAEYNLFFETGIDNASSILPIAVEQGMVEKKGGWYFIGDTKFRKGNFGKYMGDIEEKIREQLK